MVESFTISKENLWGSKWVNLLRLARSLGMAELPKHETWQARGKLVDAVFKRMRWSRIMAP